MFFKFTQILYIILLNILKILVLNHLLSLSIKIRDFSLRKYMQDVSY